MSALFDPSLYTRAPKTTFESTIVLAQALMKSCPKGMPAPVKKEHHRLQQRCERAESAWITRHREVSMVEDESTRAVDGPTDLAWTVLRDRMMAYAALPAAQFPKAVRAAELVKMLFPDASLPFLRVTYTDQLAAMSGILRRIEADGLGKDIDAVCGAEFLANVRAMMPRYEAMVHGVLARDGGVTDNLRDLLRDLQSAIVSYATKVCATVDEDDPASAETARVALLAIANLRASVARRGRGRENGAIEPVTEAEPVAAGSAPVKVAPTG
jgi:hypothetical protein